MNAEQVKNQAAAENVQAANTIKSQFNVATMMPRDFASRTAVSYTHLDVYKRQNMC